MPPDELAPPANPGTDGGQAAPQATAVPAPVYPPPPQPASQMTVSEAAAAAAAAYTSRRAAAAASGGSAPGACPPPEAAAAATTAEATGSAGSDALDGAALAKKELAAASETKPEYIEHRVRPSDTLYHICQWYGVTEQTVRLWNDLPMGSDGIQALVKLRLPYRPAAEIPGENVDPKERAIRALRHKAKCTREDAKAYLEMNKWDLDAAFAQCQEDDAWEKSNPGAVGAAGQRPVVPATASSRAALAEPAPQELPVPAARGSQAAAAASAQSAATLRRRGPQE